jgi:dihydrofolate reductase
MEESEGEFAVKMNTMPKHVASRTLKELEWNATLIEGDVPEEAARLKQQADQLLIYGSSGLVNTLMQHDLIDLYRLMIFPVVLGQGKRLFGDGNGKKPLRPVDTNTTSTGVVVIDYRPA